MAPKDELCLWELKLLSCKAAKSDKRDIALSAIGLTNMKSPQIQCSNRRDLEIVELNESGLDCAKRGEVKGNHV